MIDARDICNIRMDIGGNKPPYEFTLTVTGFIRQPIDNRIIEIVHEHGGEMAPAIAKAIDDVVLARLDGRYQGREEISDFDI